MVMMYRKGMDACAKRFRQVYDCSMRIISVPGDDPFRSKGGRGASNYEKKERGHTVTTNQLLDHPVAVSL